jgi:uncharacterized membrane protein SpoIIM required for sporulation
VNRLLESPSFLRLAVLVRELENRRPEREEAQEFPRVYRRAVQDLADARARKQDSLGPAEAILTRAHGLLYAPVTHRSRDWLGGLIVSFPRAVRRNLGSIGLAYALMAAGSAFGYAEVRRDAHSADALLPAGALENADRFGDEGPGVEGDPVKVGFYFSHNSQVAFNCFALGATFGVGTLLSLVFNGIELGATAAVVSLTRSPRALLSWLLPHAGVELTAIAIAAAGGFVIARAMIAPGFRRRRDALADAASAALPLALGAALLLIFAGLAEGWIAPKPWPLQTKGAIGLTLDALMVAYLATAGRRTPAGGPPRT